MDIDFVRRGPLSSMERENRMKQGLCLVCGEAGHRKANCPKSGSSSNQTLRETFTLFNGRNNDDVFMDAELADRLNIPLVKIPVPIKLRLADGDSSSMITHRTLPLQLHIGLGKPPSTSDISPKPSIPEPGPSGRTSDSAVDPDIDASLFKDFNMDLDLGIKRPVLQNTANTSKSVSFAETIQTEVYPFLEASPVSETPIPFGD
ncbi:hypothetical protein BASA83_012973 [Batrachochytrium salamandrivorans]|nr:hypothetical protein BASA83_012973 [Batrachochytrium salamandrivorans]